MSAIFGVYHRQRPGDLPRYLEKMDEALAQHGPDGNGIRVDGPVGIGQRLMCFTPEDRLEQQPLVAGHLSLVTDARIDNRAELAEIFGLSPSEAARLPDSAFILRAYQKWGRECGLHLIGEFAFAIWDSQKQQLFAARAPMGGRMLFYHSAGPVFAFATVPRGLLALPFVPRILNEEEVADSVVGDSRDPQATLFQGISRLLPGHFLSVDANGLDVRAYWRPDLKREIRFKNDDDYVEAFLELFDRVTSDYLRSETPVGIFLSGGLDSSSIAATAASLLKPRGQQLASFTEVPRPGFDGATFEGRYADETPLVQAIAERHPNLDAHFVRTAGKGLLDGVEALFEQASMPFIAVPNHLWIEAIQQQAREQGIRVLLSGGAATLPLAGRGTGCSRNWRAADNGKGFCAKPG